MAKTKSKTKTKHHKGVEEQDPFIGMSAESRATMRMMAGYGLALGQLADAMSHLAKSHERMATAHEKIAEVVGEKVGLPPLGLIGQLRVAADGLADMATRAAEAIEREYHGTKK